MIRGKVREIGYDHPLAPPFDIWNTELKRLCNLDLRHFKIFSASSEFINLQHGRDFGRFPLSGKR
jgi:hypothetical protein